MELASLIQIAHLIWIRENKIALAKQKIQNFVIFNDAANCLRNRTLCCAGEKVNLQFYEGITKIVDSTQIIKICCEII